MVNVQISKQRGKITALEVDGHAGYDEYGKDILCAAISALSTSLIIGLVEVLKLDITYVIKDGYIKIDLNNNVYEIRDVITLVSTFEHTVKSLVLDYGDYLRLVYKEV